MHADTIAALSTPPGTSGLAVVRLSGPDCHLVLETCLLRSGQVTAIPRHMHYGLFRHPVSGAVMDRLTFVFYPGPKTATGEAMLELFPHGNPLLVESLLRALLLIPGVRLAGPGEFTRRACENGKLDLVQAEGLMALVHAQSQAALHHAGLVLDGVLSQRLRALRQKLIDLLVQLELDVDFAEEEAEPDYASWRPRVAEVLYEIEALVQSHARGAQLNRIPRVVLLGAPNAGKSSLVNALLREERLLVSEKPGTTRDFVEVPLHLPSGLVHLVDTAGLGEAVDALDARAQGKTREQAQTADLCLWVLDGTRTQDLPLSGSDATDLTKLTGNATPVLRVRTRRDQGDFVAETGAMAVANPSGQGLAELMEALELRLFAGASGAGSGRETESRPDASEVYLTTERQREALQGAAKHLRAALALIDADPAIEILAFEAREAALALRDLLGEVTPDDVLNRLFSGFCIGK
jgi:tRNA modification GTPase